MPTLLRLEDSLERVRTGLESRARRISGRVGAELASFVGRPGKMLRARFCLLLGASLGVDQDKREAAARAMELVHTASLLHDDCVDEAEFRRGLPTPSNVFGTPVGLLLGDLAFSQGLEEALGISPDASHHLVTAVREMTVGELQEEFLKGSEDVSLEAYLGVVSRKTGALFEWCGNILSRLSPCEHEKADPPRLGCAAGILLQIVDDIHDFTWERSVSGKDRARDLSGRRLTLPGVLAVRDPRTREPFLRLWRSAGENPSAARELADFFESSGVMGKARAQGQEIVGSILALARALPCREEASQLSDFIELMAKREF